MCAYEKMESSVKMSDEMISFVKNAIEKVLPSFDLKVFHAYS